MCNFDGSWIGDSRDVSLKSPEQSAGDVPLRTLSRSCQTTTRAWPTSLTTAQQTSSSSNQAGRVPVIASGASARVRYILRSTTKEHQRLSNARIIRSRRICVNGNLPVSSIRECPISPCVVSLPLPPHRRGFLSVKNDPGLSRVL
jgi:hypothetical protein